MNLKFVKGFSFLNVLVCLLIVNMVLVVCCPVHVLGLYFFKVPVSNVFSITRNSVSIVPFYIPSIILYFLTVYFIPISAFGLMIEKLLIRYGIIAPKPRIEFTKKKKFILYTVLALAIIAYLISLGGWLHTMIPYSPEELEQLRYD